MMPTPGHPPVRRKRYRPMRIDAEHLAHAGVVGNTAGDQPVDLALVDSAIRNRVAKGLRGETILVGVWKAAIGGVSDADDSRPVGEPFQLTVHIPSLNT